MAALYENAGIEQSRTAARFQNKATERSTIYFSASMVTVQAEQPPRRVLASRWLLFSEEVCAASCFPAKGGRGRETKRGGRKAASVGRRLCLAASVVVKDLVVVAMDWGVIRSQNENLSKLLLSEYCGIFHPRFDYLREFAGCFRAEKNRWYDLVNKGTKSMKKQISEPEINLTQLVERGYAIHQQLNLLNEEFKQIKDRLKTEGLSRPGEHVPLADSESDGDQWIVPASRCECRIIFPGPRLKSEFDPTLRGFATMKNLAGDHYDKLFREVTNVQIIDRDRFRAYAKSLLPVGTCNRLFELCSTPSEPKALWKARARKANR